MKTVIKRNQRRGILLFEALMYIALLALILTFAIVGYGRFAQQSQRLQGVASDIAQTVDAGERWREDIRNATGDVEWNEESGELRIPQETSPIVYRFADGQVQRNVNGQFLPVLKNVNRSEMRPVPRQHVTSWRWELELKPRGKNVRLKPLFQFEAVSETRL